jgi:hypothetical protein
MIEIYIGMAILFAINVYLLVEARRFRYFVHELSATDIYLLQNAVMRPKTKAPTESER